MSQVSNVERQAKAGDTKKKRTRERILLALDELLAERPARSIRFAEICRRAGCSTDPLYADHHKDLRMEIETRLTARAKEESEMLPRRRRRLPITMTAELKIQQLEGELDQLKQKYQAALQTMNVLSQVIEQLAPARSASQPALYALRGLKDATSETGGQDTEGRAAD